MKKILFLAFLFFISTLLGVLCSCNNNTSSNSVKQDETTQNNNEQNDATKDNNEIEHVHKWMLKEELTKPTCTSKGVSVYECSDCGENKNEILDMIGHSEVIDKAISPTCINTGLTEGKHCSVCSEILVEQKALPVTDHQYDNDYNCQFCHYSYFTEGLIFELLPSQLEYAISGYQGLSSEVIIPSVYNDLPVTQIKDNTFYDYVNLTYIYIFLKV